MQLFSNRVAIATPKEDLDIIPNTGVEIKKPFKQGKSKPIKKSQGKTSDLKPLNSNIKDRIKELRQDVEYRNQDIVKRAKDLRIPTPSGNLHENRRIEVIKEIQRTKVEAKQKNREDSLKQLIVPTPERVEQDKVKQTIKKPFDPYHTARKTLIVPQKISPKAFGQKPEEPLQQVLKPIAQPSPPKPVKNPPRPAEVPQSVPIDFKNKTEEKNIPLFDDDLKEAVPGDFIINIPKPQPTELTYKPYSVKWVIIDSKKIINLCSPEALYYPKQWSQQEILYRERLAESYITAWDRENSFFRKLEESIKKEGFRNPIIITAGHPKIRKITEISPDQQLLSPEEMLVCEILGGSRLYFAQKMGYAIPCIVNDWVNRFPEAKTLKTAREIRECFTDPPDVVYFTDTGVRTSSPKHIHLSQNERDPRHLSKIRVKILNEHISKVKIPNE